MGNNNSATRDSGKGKWKGPNKNNGKGRGNGPITTNSTVKFPKGIPVPAAVNVRVMSDSYPGMEWAVSGVEVLGETGSSSKGKEVETQRQVVPESSVPAKE
jgi:antiviral helicase SLH1